MKIVTKKKTQENLTLYTPGEGGSKEYIKTQRNFSHPAHLVKIVTI